MTLLNKILSRCRLAHECLLIKCWELLLVSWACGNPSLYSSTHILSSGKLMYLSSGKQEPFTWKEKAHIVLYFCPWPWKNNFSGLLLVALSYRKKKSKKSTNPSNFVFWLNKWSLAFTGFSLLVKQIFAQRSS